MIRRIRVKNYRSLVDFDWTPGQEELIIGVNGSGKSSVLDLLSATRAWACGLRRLESAFQLEDLTFWSERYEIETELHLVIDSNLYCYRTELFMYEDHFVVTKEELSVDGQSVITRDENVTSWARGSIQGNPPYYLAPAQSMIDALKGIKDLPEVGRFFNAIKNILVVRPMPPQMEAEARRPSSELKLDCSNFVAWYLYMSEEPGFREGLEQSLRTIWPEFIGFAVEEAGRASILNLGFYDEDENNLVVAFDRLSEGERMLSVLYALKSYQLVRPATTLFIDEPDNFLALSEIQPWLLEILDGRSGESQLVLVSHNPEIVDSMGSKRAVIFSRNNHLSGTTAEKLSLGESALSLSELLSRGWLSAKTS